MSQLEQLFVLEKMVKLTFPEGLSGNSIVNIDPEVEITEEENTVMFGRLRQPLSLAES